MFGFKLKTTTTSITPPTWSESIDGINFSNISPSDQSLFEQLAEEEYIQPIDSGSWTISWESLFVLLDNVDYAGIHDNLKLPHACTAKATLQSNGSFSDPDFNIKIHQWSVDEEPRITDWIQVGGIISYGATRYLLSASNYAFATAVNTFQASSSTASYEEKLKSWSKIRVLSENANARLDSFLISSFVVTAESLKFELRSTYGNQLVVEPTFAGMPQGWLRQFDARSDAHSKYDISEGNNQTTVFLDPKVQAVLSAVKRNFVNRQIAGPKKDLFLRNPYALLGEAAISTVSQDEFENSRMNAGFEFYTFQHRIIYNNRELIDAVEIIICPISTQDSSIQHVVSLDFKTLEAFIEELQSKLNHKLQCCVLKGFELELNANAQLEIASLIIVHSNWILQAATHSPLGDFSERVEEIAEREHKKIADAETLIRESGYVPDCGDDSTGVLGVSLSTANEKAVRLRLSLKYKENIQDTDYAPEHVQLSSDPWEGPYLPNGFAQGIQLKKHQCDGLSWLQIRFLSNWKGCILADDMGLGKTLQSLSLMAWYLETTQRAKPCLVIAPVSLLENWTREVANFFQPGTFEILSLHGDNTRSLKCASKQCYPELHQIGVEVVLKPDWIGSNNLVLTTYETLRDLEISFGMQEWGIVLCDEAQKIKNPTAIQSKAAKTLNAKFRIACTGTPVENSLADLWSLFDFALPGYLGSLRDFAQKYRKPIEIKSVSESERLDELRSLIAPCILRRMKEQVATDLPVKFLGVDADKESMSLPMTKHQLKGYSNIANDYRARMKSIPPGEETISRMLLLKTLPHLRSICALGVLHSQSTDDISLATARTNCPKAAWVMDRLRDIQRKNEKAILFSEFRNVQRLIQSWTLDEFGIKAPIINGDVSVKSSAGNSRQDIIDQFQKTPGFGLLILGTKAVGFGVNIQAANHVIHYTRSWNPAQENQATDRAYRIGQTRNVYVYTPTVVHPTGEYLTFEEKLESLLARKRKLSEDILNGCVVGDEDLKELV